MNKNSKIASIAAFVAALLPATSYAEISLPEFVTDSMVVQQNDVLTLVGKANGTVEVKASWNNKPIKTATDKNGEFTLQIPTPKAGGPYVITLSDADSKTTLHDIYSGEVWICSGQSNMEMPIGGWGKVLNYEQEIASANNPNVRLLQICKTTSYTPQDNTPINMGGWRTAKPSTVENFSSIAYFYAREMAEKLGVHIGVIDCTWGGTPAEAWTSLDGVKSVSGFEEEISLLEDYDFNADDIAAGYEERMNKWRESLNGVSSDWVLKSYHSDWNTMTIPGEWEKSELPEFNGIVWFQKRLNIPTEWEGKSLTLRLGAIDDDDITYFNGVKIASTSGYNVQRKYTIPAELVKAGDNVISICVADYGGGGGILGNPSDISITSDNDVIQLSGEWSYLVSVDLAAENARPAPVAGSSFPTVLYNAMLHPLKVLPVKGVLWYQGCANVGRDAQYSVLFRRLINDWRELWNNPELPFYFVQLAAFLEHQPIQPDSQWAALRKAQEDALQLPYTAMVSAIDIGDAYDIHPKNKQEVAHRLATTSLKHTYGKKSLTAEAPVVKSFSTKGNTAKIKFSGKIITTDNVTPKGFIVKAEDGTWSRPEVKISASKEITLISNAPIVEIKYNWADNPDGNLRGITGLPVTPFAL